MDNRPIGVFDSGLGGLTCIPYLRAALPDERVIYFGDTDRAPYGAKTVEKIEKYSHQIADYLVESGAKMIVIACNTVSATCLDSLRKRHPDIPVIGIIEPIANKIAREESKTVRVGVIGTKVTIKNGAYVNLITSKNREVKIYSKACPLFVPIIEESLIDTEIADMTVHYYLDDFIELNEITKLVLGCTHYPLLAENIGRLYPDLELLNPSREVVTEIERVLDERDMRAAAGSPEPHRCYASELSGGFRRLVEKVFDHDKTLIMARKNFEESEEEK